MAQPLIMMRWSTDVPRVGNKLGRCELEAVRNLLPSHLFTHLLTRQAQFVLIETQRVLPVVAALYAATTIEQCRYRLTETSVLRPCWRFNAGPLATRSTM